jgi:ligand-binding SRPBCC domain-containing protein
VAPPPPQSKEILVLHIYVLERGSQLPRPIAEVFDFFSRAENLERLTPPWMRFRILTPLPIEMKKSALISYALRVHGVPVRWLTEIESWNPPAEFVDVQLWGPFKLWRHTHRFASVDGGTRIEDRVEYALPFGRLGQLVHRLQVARDLARIFDYRERQVLSHLAQVP